MHTVRAVCPRELIPADGQHRAALSSPSPGHWVTTALCSLQRALAVGPGVGRVFGSCRAALSPALGSPECHWSSVSWEMARLGYLHSLLSPPQQSGSSPAKMSLSRHFPAQHTLIVQLSFIYSTPDPGS